MYTARAGLIIHIDDGVQHRQVGKLDKWANWAKEARELRSNGAEEEILLLTL